MNVCRLTVIAMMLIIVGCQTGAEPAADLYRVPIQAVFNDSRCLSDEAGIEWLGDKAALADWWRPLSSLQFPAKPLPQDLEVIDFESSSVFVVFMGPRPTAGYVIELHDARAVVQHAALTLPVSWREPTPGTMVAQVMTNPCMVITVPVDSYQTVTVRNRQGTTLVEARP